MHERRLILDFINKIYTLAEGKRVRAIKVLIGNLSGVDKDFFLENLSTELKDTYIDVLDVEGKEITLKEIVFDE